MLQLLLAYQYLLRGFVYTHRSAWTDNDARCQRLPESTRRARNRSAGVTSTTGARHALSAERMGASSQRP